MPRTAFALIGLALALAATAFAGSRAPVPTTPPSVTATTFFASGNGWGHGVGMSQYGALGYANEGWTYDRILAHYYTAAELGRHRLRGCVCSSARSRPRPSSPPRSPTACATSSGRSTRCRLGRWRSGQSSR